MLGVADLTYNVSAIAYISDEENGQGTEKCRTFLHAAAVSERRYEKQSLVDFVRGENNCQYNESAPLGSGAAL